MVTPTLYVESSKVKADYGVIKILEKLISDDMFYSSEKQKASLGHSGTSFGKVRHNLRIESWLG